MTNTLDYYRSLSFEELIALPMEQYNEYLALLSEESNRNFHKCLKDMECEELNFDLHSLSCNIIVDATDADHIYHCAYDMEFHELVEGYAVSRVMEHYLLSGSDILANMFFTSYLCSICSILERVICERIVYEKRCSVSKGR